MAPDLEPEVWFEVGNTGSILFTMNGCVIGAIRKSDFCVVIDHDDEVLWRFRKGIVTLYKALPDLEQEVMHRIAEVELADTQRGPVSRFMRALMPLSNLDFERDYFTLSEARPSSFERRQRSRAMTPRRETDHPAEVIPFPGKFEEEA